MYLFLFYSIYCVCIHLYQYFRIGMTTGNARTGDEMRFVRQVLSSKDFITRFHHTGIVYIHILHIEPGTDTIICQAATVFQQLHHIVVEQKTHLILRIRCLITGSCHPQVTIGSVLHLVDTFRQRLGLYAFL